MQRTTALLTAALAAPALVALAPAVAPFVPALDSVKFAPEAGKSLTKTFTTNATFDLDDMSVLLNGEPNPMMPEMTMHMVVSSSIAVTDTYDSVKEGRPAKLTRRYDAATTDLEMDVEVDMAGETESQEATGSGTSRLDGKAVVFTWDADTESYKTSFPEGEEGDAELLENLAEDMDLRGLLPASGELAEGDTYTIELTSLIDLFAPGGDLKLDIEMEGEAASGGPDPTMMSDFRRIFEEMVEGEATGKYLGTREVDGVKVGVIELAFNINASRDMSEFAAEMMGNEEMPPEMEMSIDRLDIEFKYEGGGELLWNLGAGHAQGLGLKGTAEIHMDMEMNMDMGGNAMTIAMEMAMSGNLENALTVE